MDEKIVIEGEYPKSYPKIFGLQEVKVMYSQPKLYIPKDKNGKPTWDKGDNQPSEPLVVLLFDITWGTSNTFSFNL